MICPRRVIFDSCTDEEIGKSVSSGYDYLGVAEEMKDCKLNMTNKEINKNTTSELITTTGI